MGFSTLDKNQSGKAANVNDIVPSVGASKFWGRRGSRYILITFREDCATIPRLNRETKKYLRRKAPSRPLSGPPQSRQVISRSVVGPGGASTRTTVYRAPQLEQSNEAAGILDTVIRLVGRFVMDVEWSSARRHQRALVTLPCERLRETNDLRMHPRSTHFVVSKTLYHIFLRTPLKL